MVFAVAFFVNSAANFVFGIVLSALLGPAEFGRYATVALAANTLAAAVFDWLRQSSLRFSGENTGRAGIAASLDAGYLAVMAALFVGVAAAGLSGLTYGVSLAALLLTPFLALALSRIDYAGAQFRAREQQVAFAALYGFRQVFCFTAVVAVAYCTRDWALTIAALAVANLAAAIALSAPLRTPGARLRQASGARLAEFFIYAKPIVASLVVYQLVALINRQAALERLGAVQTGELSLATDLGQRLFLAVNSLPELLLFQYALQRARTESQAAGERQIGLNMVLALSLLAPLAAGYMAMAPTFEALLVPAAYRGDYARLSLELAPGLSGLLRDLLDAEPGLSARQAHLAGDFRRARRARRRIWRCCSSPTPRAAPTRWLAPIRSASPSGSDRGGIGDDRVRARVRDCATSRRSPRRRS